MPHVQWLFCDSHVDPVCSNVKTWSGWCASNHWCTQFGNKSCLIDQLPLACIAKGFNLVCYAARDIVLEGLYELGAQLQQLLLEQLLHHDFQLALQLLAFGLPDPGLKVAGLLVIACTPTLMRRLYSAACG